MTTTYFLNSIMGNVFKTKTNPALPTNYYIGLSTTAPKMDGTGVTEPTSGGYSRVKLDSLSQPSNGVLTNSNAILFEESSENWGLVTHFVIFDAASGGNLLMYDKLSTARTVEEATVVTIKSGSLELTLANPA